MIREHGFGPELGRKPTTYTCVCGFRDADYGVVGLHITVENARIHEPRRLTTIRAVGSSAAEIGIASTPYGDQDDAVEVRMLLRGGRDRRHRQHMVLVHRSSLDFLIDELEAHRLGKGLDPCAACAAQAFAARLTDAAMRTEHACTKAPESREPRVP